MPRSATTDGEQFVISDVSWDGNTLKFVSHEFKVLDRDRIHHRFWLVEEWVRHA